MRQFGRYWSVATMVFSILVFMALPAAAATPPFFGPPGMHANTEPGLVDVNGTNQQAYPEWSGGNIYLQSPWYACREGDWSFRISAYMDGGTKYVKFVNMARTFTVDQFAGGYPIGGTYDGWSPDAGTLTLEKSVAGQATYDQVHLVGTKASGGVPVAVNVRLSLVEQDGYIGVANLASVAGIRTCGQANANSQIMLPLGTGDHGQPTIILDIDGDGVADTDFYQGPPLSGSALPIPTLTEWGLIAMTLILLIAGLRFLRNNASPVSA